MAKVPHVQTAVVLTKRVTDDEKLVAWMHTQSGWRIVEDETGTTPGVNGLPRWLGTKHEENCLRG